MFVYKWQLLVSSKARATLPLQAWQRYAEDGNTAGTPLEAKRGRLWMDTN